MRKKNELVKRKIWGLVRKNRVDEKKKGGWEKRGWMRKKEGGWEKDGRWEKEVDEKKEGGWEKEEERVIRNIKRTDEKRKEKKPYKRTKI